MLYFHDETNPTTPRTQLFTLSFLERVVFCPHDMLIKRQSREEGDSPASARNFFSFFSSPRLPSGLRGIELEN